MHGFLNLFLAASFAWQGQAGESELLEILAERHAGAFDFQTAGVSWRALRLAADDLESARRAFALSYGSCSFDEPIAELRQLHLLA
jgi:hypothetical protein